MLLRVEINNVQHVKRLSLELNLEQNKLTCIVGKNGVGKTTLMRALRNLSHSDTFIRTAAKGIFGADSGITYHIGDETIRYTYDGALKSLNCKASIAPDIRALCAVELPMPYGDRFNFFQTVSDADHDIRRQIILEEYSRPDELIEFLSDIYSSDKFQSLVETRVRGRSYYSILLEDSRYVREDYLSSGEYFLINLYRAIRGAARLVVVDEIDLSLDAAAQVHLLRKLREFCDKYECNILFTTHSLAMMRTLSATELLYMEPTGNDLELYPASYSYIKTLLFGFQGWDRYILTEDIVLQKFIETVIQRYCQNAFYQFKIIYLGGGSQVSALLRRNEAERFLCPPEHAIAILDGDQRGREHANHPKIYFTPIEDVEKALHQYYAEADFPHRLAAGKRYNGPKDLFHSLQRDGVMSIAQICSYICDRNEADLAILVRELETFLSPPLESRCV